MPRRRTKVTKSTPVTYGKTAEKPKIFKDAKIRVSVEFPDHEPMEFGYSIPNAVNSVPRPKQSALAFQRAIYEGLRSEYGGMVKVNT